MAVKKEMPAKKKDESVALSRCAELVEALSKRGKNAPVVEVRQIKNVAPRKSSSKISKAQKFQLEVIARTNFNFCDGRRIAELLKENRRMWRAALMPLNLISLRDMKEDCWHADTLYLYAEEGYQYSLEELVKEQFNADEVYWIGSSSAVDIMGASGEGFEEKSQVVLSVWWD